MKKILKNEIKLNLYDEETLGIPMWRIFRFRTRLNLLKKEKDYVWNSKKKKLPIIDLTVGYLFSFFALIKIIIIKKQYENIVFSFPRLQNNNNIYFDKFTDPVIENSNIKDSCLVLHKNLAGQKKINRYKSCEDTAKTDFFDLSSHVLSIILLPVTFILFGKKINAIYDRAKNYFRLNRKNQFLYYVRFGNFLTTYLIYSCFFRFFKPKRIFVVNREAFFAQILAAKKNKISVFEFQHGATLGETPLYSGVYSELLDPDWLLLFGEAWMGNQFGIPEEKLINIGWAYNNYLEKVHVKLNKNHYDVLVISTPEKTQTIIEATIKIANCFAQYNFDIRLHPQESLTEKQKSQICLHSNVNVADNSLDSFVAVKNYEIILGENSTVLYEALDQAKIVGRMAFHGLAPEKNNSANPEGFIYLNNENEFSIVITAVCNKGSWSKLKKNGYYSKFKPELLNNIIDV